MRSEKEKLLHKFLDGELKSGEEREALHAIADEPELREMLRFKRLLANSLVNEYDDGGESFAVPPGFTDSVMQCIEAVHPENKETTPAAAHKQRSSQSGEWMPIWENIREIAGAVFVPRQVCFRPVYTLAIVLVLFMGWIFFEQPRADAPHLAETEPVTTQTVSGEQQLDKVWVRFVYFDEDAEQLAVAGDFSDWDPVELNRERIGDRQVWTGMVIAERGEHRYMFVRDGEEWVTDPLAEVQREDGFGNKNAVIYL